MISIGREFEWDFSLEKSLFSVVVMLHSFGPLLAEIARDSVIISVLTLWQKAHMYFAIQFCKCFAPLICCHIFAVKGSVSSGIILCFSNTPFHTILFFMVKASLGRMTINHDSKMVSVPGALVSFYRPSFWLAISTSWQWMVISLTVPWGHVNQPSALLSEGTEMGLHMLHSVGLTDDTREVLLILYQCPQNLFLSLISEVSTDEQGCGGRPAGCSTHQVV